MGSTTGSAGGGWDGGDRGLVVVERQLRAVEAAAAARARVGRAEVQLDRSGRTARRGGADQRGVVRREDGRRGVGGGGPPAARRPGGGVHALPDDGEVGAAGHGARRHVRRRRVQRARRGARARAELGPVVAGERRAAGGDGVGAHAERVQPAAKERPHERARVGRRRARAPAGVRLVRLVRLVERARLDAVLGDARAAIVLRRPPLQLQVRAVAPGLTRRHAHRAPARLPRRAVRFDPQRRRHHGRTPGGGGRGGGDDRDRLWAEDVVAGEGGEGEEQLAGPLRARAARYRRRALGRCRGGALGGGAPRAAACWR